MKNIPNKIYLQVCGDQDCDTCIDSCDFNLCNPVLWCEDRINDTDIEYVLSKPEKNKHKPKDKE